VIVEHGVLRGPEVVECIDQLGVELLRGRRRWADERRRRVVVRDLAVSLLPGARRTSLSVLETKISIDLAAARAIVRTSRGSKRAASSSLMMIRAALVPSLTPGGDLAPPATAEAAASFMRLVARLT